MSLLYRRRLLFVLLALLSPFWPRHALAEVTYVYNHYYIWNGIDGTGNGSTAIWDDWLFGNQRITSDGVNPPVVEVLPPDDGDPLDMIMLATFEAPINVSLHGISLPSSPLHVEVAGTLSGGSLVFQDVSIRNGALNDVGDPLPLTVSGTSITADMIFTRVVEASLTYNGTTLEAPSISLSGNDILPGGGLPTMYLSSALVSAGPPSGTGTLYLGNSPGEWKLDVSNSVLQANTIRIGPDDGVANLTLKGDTASFLFATSAVIAPTAESVVHLSIHDETPSFTPGSVLTIAEAGQAFIVVDNNGKLHTATTYTSLSENSVADIQLDHGTWTTKDLYLGGLGTTILSADNTSTLTSENVSIGPVQLSSNAVATLDHNSTWNLSGYLQVGRDGFGQLNVKNGSAVDATQEIEVGVAENSSGIVEVRDSGTLGTQTTFELGQRGTGTLNILGGGHVEADGEFSLGTFKEGVGEVVIDGTGSQLYAKNNLNAGFGESTPPGNNMPNGMGTITVLNGGVLKVDHQLVLGYNGGSQGILNLAGATSQVDLGTTGSLTIGKNGKGELNLSQGAVLAMQGDATLGAADNSEGIVTVDGQNSKWDLNGSLTVGDQGKGTVEIRNKGAVAATGTIMILGADTTGDGTLAFVGDESILDYDGEVFVGDLGKGRLSLTEGADYTTEDLTLGYSSGGRGTLHIQGQSGSLTTFTATGNVVGGKGGKADINIGFGGIATIQGDLMLGELGTSGTANDPNKVIIEGDSSQLSISGNLTIGGLGKAKVQLTGGTLNVHGDVVSIGKSNGSDGVLELSGGQDSFVTNVIIDTLLEVGEAGTGTITISGEDQELLADTVTLGKSSSGFGTIEVTGKRASFGASAIRVGGEGKGTLEVKSGARTFAVLEVVIDSLTANNASTTVSGFTDGNVVSRLAANRIVVGEVGHGVMTVSDFGMIGGISQLPTSLEVATDGGSHGTVTFNDGVAKLVDMDAGLGGTATIDILAASDVSSSGQITMGGGDGPTNLNVFFGKLTLKDFLGRKNTTIAVDFAGKMFVQDNGSISLGGTGSAPATLNILGGSQLSAESVSGPGTKLLAGAQGLAVVNVDSGGHVHLDTILVGAANGSNSSTMTITDSGSYVNSVDVVVHPNATLTASSSGLVQAQHAAVINGTVDVQSGGLRIGDPEATQTAPLGAVTVGPGGVLRGSGTIQGNLIGSTFGGTVTGFTKPKVAVGNSPGTLMVDGNISLEVGTELEVEIGGLVAGTQYDQLLATGSIDVLGALSPIIVNAGGGFQLPAVGNQFTFLTAPGGVTTAFENAATLRSVAGGSLVEWSLTGNATDSILQVAAITTLVDGDYNGDGGVDAADYIVWRKTAGGINLAADGNRDGVVDGLDLNVWRTNFGTGTAGGSSWQAAETAAVPEPSAVLLLLICSFVACTSQRARSGRILAA